MNNKELIQLLSQWDDEVEIRTCASWEGIFEITGDVEVTKNTDTNKLCIVLDCDYSDNAHLEFIK
jgi:hypothetical protein